MKFSFTTVKVRDIEESVKFYTEILGLKEAVRFSPRPGTNIVFLKDEDGNKIELIEQESMKNVLAAEGHSIVSVGFEVKDLNEILQVMKEKNIEIVQGPVETPNGVKFFYIKDPNGAEIEFIQGFQL